MICLVFHGPDCDQLRDIMRAQETCNAAFQIERLLENAMSQCIAQCVELRALGKRQQNGQRFSPFAQIRVFHESLVVIVGDVFECVRHKLLRMLLKVRFAHRVP